jgi:hypothetical protein
VADDDTALENAGSQLDLGDVLDAVISSALSGLLTALPAKVLTFSGTSGRISAKPNGTRIIRNPDTGEERSEPYAVVQEVPVVYPAGLLGGLTWPLQQGDRVLLIMTSMALDEWLGGSDQPSKSARRNKLRDAVAIAGLFPTRSIPGATTIGGAAVWLAGTDLDEDDRVARQRDLKDLKAAIVAAADGLPFGSQLKANLSAPPWPNCTAKTRSG